MQVIFPYSTLWIFLQPFVTQHISHLYLLRWHWCVPAVRRDAYKLFPDYVTVAAYIVLSPTYSRPAYRWARTTVFMSLGLGGIVPVTHGLFTVGFSRLRDEMGLVWVLISAACYINGALI